MIKSDKLNICQDNFESFVIEIHFSTWYDKLKSCQEKACSVIPQYDSMYAAQMESVTDAARKIKGIIEELREFMLENPLTTDAGKFAKVLAAKETKWKRELQEVKESLDETVANAGKGGKDRVPGREESMLYLWKAGRKEEPYLSGREDSILWI